MHLLTSLGRLQAVPNQRVYGVSFYESAVLERTSLARRVDCRAHVLLDRLSGVPIILFLSISCSLETEHMSLEFVPLSYYFGAEVKNLDLAQVLADETIEELRRAFLEYDGLLLFRNQGISREQHIAFSRRFGDLDQHEVVPKDRHPEHHELLIVANKSVIEGQENDRAIGVTWHSDLASSLRPALGSLLRAVQVPIAGGDTLFTDMYAAYEALSGAMRDMLEDLHVVYMRERKGGDANWLAEHRRLNPPVAQPVVRTHPETRRKALYVGEAARFFEGMSAAESRPLLDFLVRHATQPRFVYRHRWQNNDLLMWDNRCTMHLALADYDRSKLRHLERTTIVGTPSGHVTHIEDTSVGAFME